MNTKMILEELQRNVFAPYFEAALEKAYEEDVASGLLKAVEDAYSDADAYCVHHLTDEQRILLTEVENLYRENRAYADRYSFICGIMCAFEQLFVHGDREQYDFDSSVQKGICTMPGMERHCEFYKRNSSILEKSDALMETLEPEACEHIVSVLCAWDQRIHSNILHSFYLGYRAGLAMMDEVRPMLSHQLTAKKLLLEYDLGLTLPYEFREQNRSEAAAS